jgi:hypothetical protein
MVLGFYIIIAIIDVFSRRLTAVKSVNAWKMGDGDLGSEGG